MTNPTIPQSQKRHSDSLGSLFRSETVPGSDFLFLKSSSDIGVQRNGGRNGARLAPQSFLAYFKKLNKKSSLTEKSFAEIEVANSHEERVDFPAAQKKESQRIEAALLHSPEAFICHLGGGHDHVYPFLMALGKKYQQMIVINVDAHADTRTDEDFHSGTPFRQFSQDYAGEFFLYQIGLLDFANSQSTLSALPRGNSYFLWRNELNEQNKLRVFFDEISKNINAQTAVLFSLDADALHGAEMPGVSAVNGHGLSRNDLTTVWQYYRKLPFHHSPLMGIYELNPVYDTLSMLSMRTLGTFLYDSL